MGQEPKFTNYTEGFKGTIDYIFATCDDMYCSAAYLIPNKDALSKYTKTPLPNPQFPSDHLGLCADFHFMQPGGDTVGINGSQQAMRMPNPNSNRRNGRYHR